ncbi:MAG: hypothetical protein HDT39_11625 [Lachnospiraceae bacterium]|nr:hypothetical protein [Lachnospiraceae bacterium]
MLVENNFKRQKSIYLFYTLLPVLIFGEIVIYVYTDFSHKETELLPFLACVVLLLESIIIFVQFITKIHLHRQINALDEKERAAFQKRPLLVGPILINEKFLVEYRMFRKRIIPISNVLKAKYKEERYNGNSYKNQISFTTRNIVLTRIGEKQIVVKVPRLFIGMEPEAIVNSINNMVQGKEIREKTKDIYNEYDGDYPFYGIFLVILLGIIFLLNRIYVPFMNLFIDTENEVEVLLFRAGYERYFQIGGFVLVCLYVILSFLWKYRYMGIIFDSMLSNFVMPFLLILMFFVNLSFVDYGDISVAARKDFVNYRRGNFEYTETELFGGDSYFISERNYALENLTTELSLKLSRFVSRDTMIEFMFLYNDSDIVKEHTYQIKYLKHTGLIVEIF